MGHTNTTPNYALPQFITTDKPAWLTDINGAFSAIDTGIDTAQDTANSAQNDATQALSDASAAATAASTADAKGAGAVASIADTFDPTTVYSVGEKVMYNNLLYICSVAVVTPGPWTGSANWTRATVEGIIDGLNGDKLKLSSNPSAPTINNAVTTLSTTVSGIPVIKSVLLTGTVACNSVCNNGIGAYRTSGGDAPNISTAAGYPTGKTIIGYSVEYAHPNNTNASEAAIINIIGGVIYANAKVSGYVAFGIRCFYID